MRRGRRSVAKQVCTCQFSVPEVKIAFILFYWLIESVLFWTVSGIRNGRDDAFEQHLRSYADCMAGGDRRDHDCNSLRMNLETGTNPVLEFTGVILVALLNFVTLAFVIQIQTVKRSLRRATRNLSKPLVIIAIIYNAASCTAGITALSST